MTTLPSKILGVNYHYCDLPDEVRWPGLKGVTQSEFERQLSILGECYASFSLDDLPLNGVNSASGATGCLITFDDGMVDVVKSAMPALQRSHLPAIIFCCALPYQEERVLNVQKSHLLLGRWGWEGFRCRFMAALQDDPEGDAREDSTYLCLDRMYRYDDQETGAFKRLLNVLLPYRVVDRILDRMFEAEFGPQRDAVKCLYLSLDDIRRCVDGGIGIGLHTYSHRMLSRLSRAEQAADMDASLALFREQLGLKIRSISYPYGIPGSWNDDSKQLARERGLDYAFTLGREVYCPQVHRDPMTIPRYDVNDVFNRRGVLKQEFFR